MGDAQQYDEDKPLLAGTSQQILRAQDDPEAGSHVAHAAPYSSATNGALAPGSNGDHHENVMKEACSTSRARVALYGSHFLSTWGQVGITRQLPCIAFVHVYKL